MSAAATLRRLAAPATLLLTVFVAGAAGASVPRVTFAPGGPISVGSWLWPCAFVVAKLDGDSELDLAVTDCMSDDLSVLLGDGVGHFRNAGAPLKVGDRPASVVDADFNGDGKEDLAVSNEASKDVSVLLGNGSGGFGAAPGSPLKIGRSPRHIASADLNGDGRMDLIVPAYPTRLAILLGDGSGRFSPAPGSPISVGGRYGPDAVAVADFNGDQRPDLAVAGESPTSTAILLGNGAGGFRTFATIRATFLSVADFNGDAMPDLAVKISLRGDREQGRLLLGTGSGRFSSGPGFPLSDIVDASAVVSADLNGDQRPDLAVASERTTVLLGDGRRLGPAADSPFPLPASSEGAPDIAAADLNRDGQSEIVVSVRRDVKFGAQPGLAVLWRTPSGPTAAMGGRFPGRGDAVFATRSQITTLAADGRRAAVATVRRDPCNPIFHIAVWTPGRRKSPVFHASCGGDAIGELALGAGQVVWLAVGGGNDLNLELKAARITGGKPRQIEFTTNGYRAGGEARGGWLGQLLGSGPLLAYNSWTITCNVPDGYGCDPGVTPLILSRQRLMRIVERRQTVAKRGRESFSLAAVGGGRMAVETDGAISVLAPNGKRLARVAAVADNPPRGIELARNRLVVMRTFSLDLYNPATGRQTKSIPLGPAAILRLAGVNSSLALLGGPRRLVLVRLSDGKLISLALRTKSHVDAKLTSAGLFFAYNAGRRGGRVVFEPTARLLARF